MRAPWGLARDRGLDRERVDRAVLEARLDRLLDQPVLVDPREPLELRSGDGRVEVVLRAGLVHHLDLGSGQGRLDQQADLCDRDGHQTAVFAASIISSTLQNLTRGRPWGSPFATSAASIA